MMSEQRKPETMIMEDEPTHTAQNDYECGDPECICHTAQQALREAQDQPGKTVSRNVAPGLLYKNSVRKT